MVSMKQVKTLMGHLRTLSLLLSLSLSLVSLAVHASISVEVKPKKVAMGETFSFVITADDANFSGQPNLASLKKAFHITGTQQSINYTVLNGKTRALHQWVIMLMPKKLGKQKIPAIKIGSHLTPPIEVNVIKTSLNQTPEDSPTLTARQDEVMLKTEVNQAAPLINQEVLYTVKLYNSGRLLDAEYHPPSVENALMIPLGNSDRYQTQEKGQDYIVEEQHYAIFPQKSGPLTISGPSFNAVAYEAVPRRITVPPKDTTLQVKPIPKSFKAKEWLPAANVSLTEHYEQHSKTLDQGDTVQRIITIEAEAVPAQLLPSLTFKDAKAYNIYPEKPTIKNIARNNHLVGQATIKVTYLLNHPGQVTLPEIEVPWFNTKTGQTEIAKLPPHSLKINPKTQAPPPLQNSSTKDIKSQPADQIKSDDKDHKGSPPIAWFVAIGFAVAWIVTLMMWWFKPFIATGSLRRRAVKKLHEACIRNNPTKAREALLNWASIHWPERSFLDLKDIANCIQDVALKKELSTLSQILYSKDKKSHWHGTRLWLAIASFRRKKKSKNKTNHSLPPINP